MRLDAPHRGKDLQTQPRCPRDEDLGTPLAVLGSHGYAFGDLILDRTYLRGMSDFPGTWSLLLYDQVGSCMKIFFVASPCSSIQTRDDV